MESLRKLIPALVVAASVTVLLSACGGGDPDVAGVDDATTTSASSGADDRRAILRRGGRDTTTTTTTTTTPTSVLPTTAPAPGVLVRESFGFGTTVRPYGDTGGGHTVYAGTALNGFWVEYPGSAVNKWITPTGEPTWKFAAIGGYLDPYALPSPLEPDLISQGAMVSSWFDPVSKYPTALLPLAPQAQPYAVSMEGYPAIVAGAYVAIGLTASKATVDNFTTSGQVWLGLRKQQAMTNGPLVYEWRLNGRSGPLLATGVVNDVLWNRMEIRHDPVLRTVSATVNGIPLGTASMSGTPSYAGFEGVGVLDNFVVRSAP